MTHRTPRSARRVARVTALLGITTAVYVSLVGCELVSPTPQTCERDRDCAETDQVCESETCVYPCDLEVGCEAADESCVPRSSGLEGGYCIVDRAGSDTDDTDRAPDTDERPDTDGSEDTDDTDPTSSTPLFDRVAQWLTTCASQLEGPLYVEFALTAAPAPGITAQAVLYDRDSVPPGDDEDVHPLIPTAGSASVYALDLQMGADTRQEGVASTLPCGAFDPASGDFFDGAVIATLRDGDDTLIDCMIAGYDPAEVQAAIVDGDLDEVSDDVVSCGQYTP